MQSLSLHPLFMSYLPHGALNLTLTLNFACLWVTILGQLSR